MPAASTLAVQQDAAPATRCADPYPGWHRDTVGRVEVHWAGEREIAAQLADALAQPTLDAEDVLPRLRQHRGFFAAIVASGDRLIAAVDHVRSTPVFWAPGPVVSNSARLLRQRANLTTTNAEGVLDMVMAGYVSGNETVVDGLRQLRPGEVLIAAAGRFAVHRYYQYLPAPRDESRATLLDELESVTNDVFRRVVDKANGRPIWVPLSGGYDSRLILCKLHELRYPRLQAFTYGPRFNYDAKVAKHVARTLGVPWRWLPGDGDGARRAFADSRRRPYWDFADGLSVIPSMREWQPLLELVDRKAIPADAIIISGQSGDYISGGHVPPTLFHQSEPTRAEAVRGLVKKHWSLWTNWNAHPVAAAAMQRRLERELQQIDTALEDRPAKSRLLAALESWEWAERQSKYVVNDHRVYEFFGLGWDLPLWDQRYVAFWEKVPFAFKLQQGLFKEHLARWNYRGLFGAYSPPMWRWPLPMMWVLPVAQVVGALLGANAKQRFYRSLWYFGHYHNVYAMYGFAHYRRTVASARSVVSLQVERWLAENELLDRSPNDGPTPAMVAALANAGAIA